MSMTLAIVIAVLIGLVIVSGTGTYLAYRQSEGLLRTHSNKWKLCVEYNDHCRETALAKHMKLRIV